MNQRTITALVLVVLVLGTSITTVSGPGRAHEAHASVLRQSCQPSSPTPGPTITPEPAVADPALLRLPNSALPPNAHVDHDGISDNADADGTTTPPDCVPANLRQVHSNFYEVLGRKTGYRMDFMYQVQGVQIGTEYLASIFSDADHAKSAMTDATSGVISLVGSPLPDPCPAGDTCKAYSGSNPLNASQKAVYAVFTRGAIMVELGSQVPSGSYSQIQTALETQLYSILNAADAQAKLALSSGTKPSATNTQPKPTDTPVPPTATPKPTAKPTAKPKKKVTCKKGYKLVKGKCKKVKKKKKKHA